MGIGAYKKGADVATITSITICNFKGIKEVTLDFDKKGQPPVTTLIGLNESGKTTILEALSHFVSGDSAVSSLFDGVHSKSAISSLIPVNKKANFTGDITISAKIKLTEQDFKSANKLAETLGLELDPTTFIGTKEVRRSYRFKDSVYEDYTNYWEILLQVKKGRTKRYTPYKRPAERENDLFIKITNGITKALPRIAYFPTFLVDMPEKIYLAEHPKERPVNKYYRLVFQDILDSLDEDLTLTKHVVDRISTYKQESENSNWLSMLFGSSGRTPIDSVFSKISAAVTKQVLGSWQKIFQRNISAKNILVEWGVDTEKDDLPYATFYIHDGESRYFISDRSLGFRWFFSFLLFTAFKQKQKRPTLFVFDEPAANLHAKAQTELLKSFSRTVAGGDGIVYSTHSHHMINPSWISGAHIVENTALDYDSEEDTFGLNSKPTNIVVTPYRHFVAQHPTRTSYFQPVIDVLEYVTPEIVGRQPFVLVEGISDFYALKLAAAIKDRTLPFSIMPGVGSGAMGPQISLLLGRGEKFVVLLDDDKAGNSSAGKYRSDWFLSDQQVFTLVALGKDYKGKRIEGLVSADTLDIVSSHLLLNTKPNKKQLGLYFSEMYASGALKTSLSDSTVAELNKLLDMLGGRLDKN